MFEIVNFRFDWENCKIIICMMYTESRKHFYISETIESEQDADEIISFWEMQTTGFSDVLYQHPN